MSKEELEPKLAEVMNNIPEVEGIIAFDQSGNVITGQTIDTSMDLADIAKKSLAVYEALKPFGVSIGKGEVGECTVFLETGFAVISFGDYNIIAFVGEDGKSQLALIARTLKNIIKK